MADEEPILDPHSDCDNEAIVKYIQHLEAEIKILDAENKVMRLELESHKRYFASNLRRKLESMAVTHG